MKRLLVAMMVLALCLPVMVFAQEAYTPCADNLIYNGDFQLGNVGFQSQYTYVDPSGTLYPPKVYTVGLNPRNHHSQWASFGDHTTGSGKMMIINTADATGTDYSYVWQQTVDVAAYSEYVFKYWVALAYPSSPPILKLKANGEEIGEFQGSAKFTPTGTNDPVNGKPNYYTGQWVQASFTYTSGAVAGPVTFQIVDVTGIYHGCDYVLDDIELCFQRALSCADTELIAGQNTPVGIVSVQKDGDDLKVTFTVDEPWCFTELHLAYAENKDGIPQKNGNPIPGKFAYKYKVPEGACGNTYTFTIPNRTCPLVIAAHAVVRDKNSAYECTVGGVVTTCYRTETAWGWGKEFPGSNWAMYFEAPKCCTTP